MDAVEADDDDDDEDVGTKRADGEEVDEMTEEELLNVLECPTVPRSPCPGADTPRPTEGTKGAPLLAMTWTWDRGGQLGPQLLPPKTEDGAKSLVTGHETFDKADEVDHGYELALNKLLSK